MYAEIVGTPYMASAKGERPLPSFGEIASNFTEIHLPLKGKAMLLRGSSRGGRSKTDEVVTRLTDSMNAVPVNAVAGCGIPSPYSASKIASFRSSKVSKAFRSGLSAMIFSVLRNRNPALLARIMPRSL